MTRLERELLTRIKARLDDAETAAKILLGEED